MKKYLFFLLGLIAFAGCKKDDVGTKKFSFEKPVHFPEPTYTFDKNPVTKEGFELGKKLFADPILSVDNSVACNNCHVKSVAFTDPQHSLSLGVEERSGIRNAPSIANMAFMKEFFWDGGGIHLDFVPPNAIENPLEMDEKLAHVVYKLNHHSSYPALFKKAFSGIETITAPYMLYALSQYQVMLVSASSKYDKYKTGDEMLGADELEGLEVFEQKCAACHSGELFTNQDYRNNGLDTEFDDPGRARITESDADLGKFKVPSLRNVALTAPYMHDGRFKTLEEVLEHYSAGVKQSATLAPELQQNGTLGIPLSATEKQRLIDFLKTLTDYDFIQDQRF
ncbi:MAG: c-type cytochrome [Lewinellaceae bacterium]|nr:c-type cytochrome [Lewinellaceae bacterium]